MQRRQGEYYDREQALRQQAKFANPNYLNLARQFMSGPQQPGSQYAGRFPNMGGYSRTPTGQSLMMRVLDQMRRRQGAGQQRMGGTPQGVAPQFPPSLKPGPQQWSPQGQRPPIGRVSVDFQKLGQPGQQGQ